MVVERPTNGKAYRAKNIIFGNERQVIREQIKKTLTRTAARESEKRRWLQVLPRFGRVNLR